MHHHAWPFIVLLFLWPGMEGLPWLPCVEVQTHLPCASAALSPWQLLSFREASRCLHVLDRPLSLPLEWPLYRAGVSLCCTSTDHRSLECWHDNHPFILLCSFMQQILIVCLCVSSAALCPHSVVLWFLSLAFHCPNPLSFELHARPVFQALSRARPP